MTQKEAIHLARLGNIITHSLFSDNEFIYSEKGQLFTEDGYKIRREFWEIRAHEIWNDGWKIYKGFEIGKEYKYKDNNEKHKLLRINVDPVGFFQLTYVFAIPGGEKETAVPQKLYELIQ